jgi:hypothetical protein
MAFKKIVLATLAAFLTYPSNANATQPFRYTTSCFLPSTNTSSTAWVKDDKCTVIEVRAEGGALLSRSIFSNLFSLTVKSRFVKGKGFVTWDSYNKFEYTWEYKTGMIPGSTTPMSYVMPGFLVENVSWD